MGTHNAYGVMRNEAALNRPARPVGTSGSAPSRRFPGSSRQSERTPAGAAGHPNGRRQPHFLRVHQCAGGLLRKPHPAHLCRRARPGLRAARTQARSAGLRLLRCGSSLPPGHRSFGRRSESAIERSDAGSTFRSMPLDAPPCNNPRGTGDRIEDNVLTALVVRWVVQHRLAA
jgi:hypothetical protein